MKKLHILFVILMAFTLSGCDLLGNKQLECEEGYYEYEGFCVDEDKIYDEDDVRYTFIRLRLNTDDIENLYSDQEYCKDYFINFDECALHNPVILYSIWP